MTGFIETSMTNQSSNLRFLVTSAAKAVSVGSWYHKEPPATQGRDVGRSYLRMKACRVEECSIDLLASGIREGCMRFRSTGPSKAM
jgi:hypothetical protein